MVAPCAVAPFHRPSLSDEEAGDAGPPQAQASIAAIVPTQTITFVIVSCSWWGKRKGPPKLERPPMIFAFFLAASNLFVAFAVTG